MDGTELRRIFGRNIRELRKGRGLTQQALAEKVGISQPGLAAIEGGNVNPEMATIARIADALETPPDVLFRPGIFSTVGA